MEWGLGVSGVQFDTIPDESSNGTMIGITRMKMPSAASASLQNGIKMGWNRTRWSEDAGNMREGAAGCEYAG